MSQVIKIIIIIIITALLVGGGFYVWQKFAFQSMKQKEQITINTSKSQGNKEKVAGRKKVQLDPRFLSVVSVSQGDENIIKSLNKNGIFQDIKSYKPLLPSGRYALLFYLNYEPTIYISGIGENGYTTMDLSGRETSEEHAFLRDKEFSVTDFVKLPNEDKIIYPTTVDFQKEVQKEVDKVITIFDYKNNKIDYIESDILPHSKWFGSRVIGLSKNKQFLYVMGVDGELIQNVYLWKVDLQAKTVDEIIGVNEVNLRKFSLVPYLDLAVGIESQETACDGCFFGVTDAPPSKLNLFDLKNNSYKTLLTSNLVLDQPILVPAGNKIFYSEQDSYNIYSINIDGSNKKLIAKNAIIQGMSYNGEKIIIELRTGHIFKILDLEKNSENIIPFLESKDLQDVKFLSCSYPLGYSCLY